jgi:hypothetical protein
MDFKFNDEYNNDTNVEILYERINDLNNQKQSFESLISERDNQINMITNKYIILNHKYNQIIKDNIDNSFYDRFRYDSGETKITNVSVENNVLFIMNQIDVLYT